MTCERLTCARSAHFTLQDPLLCKCNPLGQRIGDNCSLSQRRYFFDLRHTVGEDMLLLQMGNKRIETLIVRHDVEIRILVGCGNATNVERNMKVERIVPRAHHLNVLGARTEFLNHLDQGERQLG